MTSKHRKPAIIGLSLWLVSFVALIAGMCGAFDPLVGGPDARDVISPYVLLPLLLAGCALFYWGTYHLARGKGYSDSLAIVGAIIPCVQLLLVTLLLVLPDKNPERSSPSHPERQPLRSHSRESSIARNFRLRRNALVANCFGVFGILLGAAMVLFPVWISESGDLETILSIVIFFVGYGGVIAGCRWWAIAKAWPDGVVFIALSPLAIGFVPGVRLIYVAEPLLLPMGMVMMPLALIVVVLVLPDKSGVQQRKRKSWDRE